MSKVVIVSTWMDDNLERATIPWVVATAGVATDKEVTVFLQGPAVIAATKEGAGDRHHPPFPPIAELVEMFVEAGGVIKCCAPCLASRNIDEADLIDDAKIAGAAYLVEAMEGASVLSY